MVKVLVMLAVARALAAVTASSTVVNGPASTMLPPSRMMKYLMVTEAGMVKVRSPKEGHPWPGKGIRLQLGSSLHFGIHLAVVTLAVGDFDHSHPASNHGEGELAGVQAQGVTQLAKLDIRLGFFLVDGLGAGDEGEHDALADHDFIATELLADTFVGDFPGDVGGYACGAAILFRGPATELDVTGGGRIVANWARQDTGFGRFGERGAKEGIRIEVGHGMYS